MDKRKYIEEITRRLKTIEPLLIILFGSYVQGKPDEESDIDILVVTDDDFIPSGFSDRLDYSLSVKKLISDIIKEVPVDLLVYSRPMFEKFVAMNSSFSREILEQGKKLYESDNQRVA